MFKTPFARNRDDFATFEKCIMHAATGTSSTEFLVAEMLTHFLEELCAQVFKNRIVEIPGLGKFGWQGYYPHREDLRPYVFPAFNPSREFSKSVRQGGSPQGLDVDAVTRYRRHHHPTSRRDKVASRPFKAFETMRHHIKKQAQRVGYE